LKAHVAQMPGRAFADAAVAHRAHVAFDALGAEPAVAVAQAAEAQGRIAPGLAHFLLGDFASVAGLLLALAQLDAVEGAEAGLAAAQVAALLVGQPRL
jgi:hypothetical protein